MSVFLAFYGGLYNFFSLWILCLTQVLPFLFATMAGSVLMTMGGGPWRDNTRETVIIFFCILTGFALMYCSLGSATTALASFLFQYQPLLLQIGGAFLFLTSFYFLGILKVPPGLDRPVIFAGNLMVGAVLGLAYQPCITPILAKIYNLLKDPDAFSQGFLYLTFYTLGLTLATAVVGFLLVLILSWEILKGARGGMVKVCGGILLLASIIILLEKMTVYKGLLVGM